MYIFLRVKELFRDYLFGRSDFDTEFFIQHWESKFGKTHDPVPEEIFLRILTVVPPGGGICELGAGYGRIAELLENHYNLSLLEPDKQLCEILRSKFPKAKIIHGDSKSVIQVHAQLYFSVRALEYASFIELVSMFNALKKSSNTLICWERRYTLRKIEFAAMLTRYRSFYPQSLVN